MIFEEFQNENYTGRLQNKFTNYMFHHFKLFVPKIFIAVHDLRQWRWCFLAIIYFFWNAFSAERLMLRIEEFQKNTKSGSLFKKVITYSVGLLQTLCTKNIHLSTRCFLPETSCSKQFWGYQFLPGFINWRPSCLGMGWHHSCRSLITALLFSYPLFLPCCRLYSQLTLFLRPALPCSQRENDAAGEPQNVAVMPPCTRDTTEW